MLAALSAIGGVAALGSSIYGAIASSKYNKQARKLIEEQKADNRNWYDVKMSEDYTQRSDTQAALKRQRELLTEQYDNARKTNAVMGGTDEALALQKQAANNSLSQTITDIASQASQYKEGVENQYRATDAALTQQQVTGLQQQGAQAAQAAAQATNAGINLLGGSIKKNDA